MGKRTIREGYTQPSLYFEQINEVSLMEKMYCMHLARKKLTITHCKHFRIKNKIIGWVRRGVILNEIKYLIFAIDIVYQLETD